MKIDIHGIQNNRSANIATRCPHCGHFGAFQSVGGNDHVKMNGNQVQYYLGLRKCPNAKCHGHLFFIADSGNNLLLTSPSETIPFDKENIPDGVLNSIDEAIKCHSYNCFIASAIMIRKTLEEICHDREANGKNLALRLKDLGTKILIPKELFRWHG